MKNRERLSVMETRFYTKEALFAKTPEDVFTDEEIFAEVQKRAEGEGKTVDALMKQEVLSMLKSLVQGKGLRVFNDGKYQFKKRQENA